MAKLRGEYYQACNDVFRQATNQGERMLEAIGQLVAGRQNLNLLSVGSGSGLLEVPLLKQLLHQGVALEAFVGIDVSRSACRALAIKLSAEFGSWFEWEVINQSYQEFQSDRRFDLVLFSHTFEYLEGDPLRWVHKSLRQLTEAGNLLIISPDSGGINKIYAEMADGFRPIFSEALREALELARLRFAVQPLQAECDISLLDQPDQSPKAIRLLSFLTQLDCRRLPPATRQQFIDYYQSLRPAGRKSISHPATLFVL